LDRVEKRLGQSIRPHIVVKESYAYTDFVKDYNSLKGNAYGLANTIFQTAFLKPSMKSKKVKNLYYTGQLTVPGPGVPPCLISGQVVANLIEKENK
jgi:phytoene desaturase